MERIGIQADALATNDAVHITAQSRAAKAAPVRQTIRSMHDACGQRRQSCTGIRPARTLILR
ncbi:hypothetical protein [Burkholderia sp. BCC0322]|uniref:hypothetical protein n=1 Tax=Burkholderia sp. BCC0322 TaxID=2676296 RepID=UPI00158E5942|nr:hypothetical protein [Burkholderia sp. BCC0322]